jgi:hypothetical protein
VSFSTFLGSGASPTLKAKAENRPKKILDFLVHFSYFLIIFVLFEKYGKQYENIIVSWESVRIRLGFHTVRFYIGRKNPVISQIYLGFFRPNPLSNPSCFRIGLFFLASPRRLAGQAACHMPPGRTVQQGWAYYLLFLIQRFSKYSNNSKLQNKKPVLPEL